jgi:PAS domain S-box-containing protein
MTSDASQIDRQDADGVSSRFLTDFFHVLARHAIPATQLLGDLPISRGEMGEIMERVDWSTFSVFMKRLEREVGGPEGLEACGHMIGEFKPAGALRSLAGLTASPFLLYRAAIEWALRRALPGIEAHLSPLAGNEFEIHARLADSLRPCPAIFHFATGCARALPRILGMTDAVVSADVGETHATYRVRLPPSLTLFARLRRTARSLFSAGSVLQFLEAQQLELHAQRQALQRTNAALEASEQRHRALTDAAVDVLCEIDDQGRIVYVSASIQDLLGYSPEQVTGSHYRLWLPREFHTTADARFEAMTSQPTGDASSQEIVTLHADQGRKIVTEISVRSYETPDGEWRMVGILRDVTDRFPRRAHSRTDADETLDPHSVDRLRTALTRFRVRRHPPNESSLEESSPAAHPLQRSLEILIGSLEQTELETNRTRVERMTNATRRMTQVVEGALVHTHAADADWIDTRKLMDILLVGFTSGHGDRGVTLEIALEDAPAQIWGRIDLLTAALDGLLDHAAALAATGGRIRLTTRIASHAEATPVVEFTAHVARPRRGGTPSSTTSGRSRRERESDDLSALGLAIARDVASLIDAEVSLTDRGPTHSSSPAHSSSPTHSSSPGGASATMRIPQPPPPGMAGLG